MRKMSKIVCRSFQRVIEEGKRLKIIKLENYNAAEELLIETGTQSHWASYDIGMGGQRVRGLGWLSTWRETGVVMRM